MGVIFLHLFVIYLQFSIFSCVFLKGNIYDIYKKKYDLNMYRFLMFKYPFFSFLCAEVIFSE